jgi:hypothetical protein
MVVNVRDAGVIKRLKGSKPLELHQDINDHLKLRVPSLGPLHKAGAPWKNWPPVTATRKLKSGDIELTCASQSDVEALKAAKSSWILWFGE